MLDVLKYLFHGTGNNTSLRVRLEVFKALHSESFSCSRLTIGQNSRVIALKDGLDCWPSCGIVHKALRRVGSIDMIEGE